jgi:hypothetical protein
MVSFILIIEALEHVAKGPLLILKMFAWKLFFFLDFILVVDMFS